MKSPYVTTSPYSAEYFGKYHGEPRIVEVKVPENALYWADDAANVKKRAYIKDLKDEDIDLETGKRRDDFERLMVVGYVKPEQIKTLSRERQILKVEKEKKTWGGLDD